MQKSSTNQISEWYWSNIRIFVWDYNHLIKKIKINYDGQFKINKIINDETKRKKIKGRLLKKMETNYKIKKKN